MPPRHCHHALLLLLPQAAGLLPPEGATLFAPTNKALADEDLQEDIGLTIIELLQPAHKDTLVKVCVDSLSDGQSLGESTTP